MLVVSLSQGKTQLTVFDANITPYEHKSLFSVVVVFVFISAGCWSVIRTKKAVCFVGTQEAFCNSLAVNSLCLC